MTKVNEGSEIRQHSICPRGISGQKLFESKLGSISIHFISLIFPYNEYKFSSFFSWSINRSIAFSNKSYVYVTRKLLNLTEQLIVHFVIMCIFSTNGYLIMIKKQFINGYLSLLKILFVF